MNVIKSETIIKNFNKKGQKFYFWWSNNDERIIPVEIVSCPKRIRQKFYFWWSNNDERIIPVEIVSCPKRISEYNMYRYHVGIAFENINYISVPAHTLYTSRKELIEDRINQLEEDWKIDNNVFKTDRSWYERQIEELKKML